MLTVNTPTVIQNAINGTGPLTIMGTSPLTLSGPDTGYSGGISVQGGILYADGSLGSTGVNIASSSTLGGTGAVGAILAPGGVVIPGDPSINGGIGILSALSADLTSGGILIMSVAGYATPGTSYDQLNLGSSGNLNLDGTSSITFNLQGVTVGGTTAPGGLILDGSGSSSFAGGNVAVFNNTSNFPVQLDYSTPGEVNVDVTSNPVFTSSGSASFMVLTNSSFTVTTSGFPIPTITESGPLPNGVTFNGAVLSGTPSPGTAGIYHDTFTAMNSGGSATQTFALTIQAIPTSTSLVDLGGATTPSFLGSSVTFTVAVTASSSVAGDTVILENAGAGNATVGTGTLTASGNATITTTTLPLGTDSIFAVYSGDASFAGSQSPVVVQQVQNTGTTATTLQDMGPNPSLFGGAVTFTTSVAASGSVAGDTVTLEDASNGNASVGSGTLNSSGAATITVSSLAVGSHSIFAVFGGDGSNSGSQSSSVVQAVQSSTTTTLNDNSPNPSLLGQADNFTVTVAGGTVVNGETVTLEDASNGNATLGSATLSGGSATITANGLVVGPHNIFAVYGGDTTHAASQSAPITQGVVGLKSFISALPPTESTNQFDVTWVGSAGTGWTITGYTVFVSDNFGLYTTLVSNTTQTDFVYTGQNNHTYSFFSVTDGTTNLGVATMSLGSATATTTVRSVPPTDLTVTSLTPTPTGFTATFSQAFLNTTSNPVHLYDASASNANYGPPDVTLVGAKTGPVTGSLVINATNTGFTFIKTNLATGGGAGGLLAPDTYTVTFLSGPLAFQDTNGGLLDGNGSGVGGTNFTSSFAVTAQPAGVVTVSIPGFARGPDGNVADSINLVNAQPSPLTGGIPVTLNIPSGDAVTSAVVTVVYNTSQLTVNAAFPNAALTGASFTSSTTTSASGVATTTLTFSSPTALPIGNVVLGGLVAYVPATAPYRSKQLLQISSVVNGGAIATINDNSLEAVAFLGNTSGTGSYSSLDSGLLLNVSSGADAGFASFPALDPAIVGDLNGNGAVDSGDAVQLNARNTSGSNPAFVPPYPGAPTNTQAGPDPTLSIPSVLTVNAGGTVLVPVNIDDAKPAGSMGMKVATLALRYDPSQFTVTPQDVQLGSVPAAGNGWQLQTVVDSSTGEIGITLASQSPINSSTGGSLVIIVLQEKSTATPGSTPVELVASVTPNGQVFTTSVDDVQGPFTLTPTPTNSGLTPGLVGTVLLPRNYDRQCGRGWPEHKA